jgi:hypothetical protein
MAVPKKRVFTTVGNSRHLENSNLRHITQSMPVGREAAWIPPRACLPLESSPAQLLHASSPSPSAATRRAVADHHRSWTMPCSTARASPMMQVWSGLGFLRSGRAARGRLGTGRYTLADQHQPCLLRRRRLDRWRNNRETSLRVCR